MKNIKELILKGNKFTIKGGLKNIYKIEESESKTKKSFFLGKCWGVDSKVSTFEACLSKINDNSFTYFTFIMERKVSGRVYFKDLILVGNE